ncbi:MULTISPECIES: DUF1942 domain-containing protein [Mycobacteriaceae]|uniref:DUF1942 domain-containing protein n=1 Tax=Mycolicibacterium austroafricanum TaxID=39687 RepID=A0ABT8H908_MYCAO|nr:MULTISPECIES: DUF1942 domain-containing protein [Mycobacteriaceae]MDN4517236.1 DUF1942 domain-containing protein [Mycolicibacterium austroafricanum]
MGYTVSDLQPANTRELTVPVTGNVPLADQLWYATTTVAALHGSIVPAMESFSARNPQGQNYRVIEQALAPDLKASPMSQGQRTTGHLYFDVTGPPPTAVVYNDGMQDRLAWAGAQ